MSRRVAELTFVCWRARTHCAFGSASKMQPKENFTHAKDGLESTDRFPHISAARFFGSGERSSFQSI